MRLTNAFLVTAFSLIFSTQLQASQTFVGTIVFKKGDAKILKDAIENPTAEDKKKHLIFEGKKYQYEEIRVGKRIIPGTLIQTGADGKIKIVYPNGDHFNLGPGTFLSMPKPSKDKGDSKTSTIDLFYGRLRSMISKDGPRNKLKVETPATTAGVRGTDFFVRHNLSEGSSVTVMRGQVALNAEEILVKKAEKAVVKNSKAKPKVSLAEKQDLLDLQKESSVVMEKADMQNVSKKVKKEIHKLEVQSKKAVLKDIKAEDPTLYKEIISTKKGKDLSAEEISSQVVARLMKQAPGKIKEKPSEAELEGAAKSDVYKRYFETPE